MTSPGFRDLDPARTATTLPTRLCALYGVIACAVIAFSSARAAQHGISTEHIHDRIQRVFSPMAPGDPDALVWKLLPIGLMFGGIALSLLPAVLAGQGLRYRPAEQSGVIEASSIEEAVETLCARCREMGFDPRAALGEELREGVDPAGAQDFPEASVFAIAEKDRSAGGHEAATRTLQADVFAKAGRWQVDASVRFADLILVDTGETDYCRDVALKLLGRKGITELTRGPSFLACVAFTYGVLACVPALAGAIRLGPQAALGWRLLACAAGVALGCGLLSVYRILRSRGRTYGLSIAAEGVVLAAVGVGAALLSQTAPFIE